MENQTSEEEKPAEKNKLFKAKFISLLGKIVGAVVIVGGSVLKWVGKLPGAEIDDICKVGFCTMGIFSTIDINILIDKFTKK